jgi:hypothetical protein
MKNIVCVKILILIIALFFLSTVTHAEPWRFGIMGDTQWKRNTDGKNPHTVSVGIIRQLNQQFIDAGVKFVIQVGDLTNKGNAAGAMETRAAAAQDLYAAGIGFYPLRGNHDDSQFAALKFQRLYPQTIGNGPHVYSASNFSSPFNSLRGLSYAFDYRNARFLLLDQFTRTHGINNRAFDLQNWENWFDLPRILSPGCDYNLFDQQSWINEQLTSKGSDRHGFVFSHKELIAEKHADTIFGADPSANPKGQNAFFHSLQSNGVRYEIGGHDHNHSRSLVISPDGKARLQNIIVASDSDKFYTPRTPSNDRKYNLPAFGFRRETPISQELYTIGYYIVTVDGPRVSVDYYASDNGCGGTLGHGKKCRLSDTPELEFFKRETFGYSLNGREFLIPQGESYASIQDNFEGTTAEILAGVNGSSRTFSDGRPTTKDVNTGWTSLSDATKEDQQTLVTNILTLWGMADLDCKQTDTYVLSMGYDDSKNGKVQLVSKNENGHWVNAVDRVGGGSKQFVSGPWESSYKLGTYGVDPASETAWAVINYNGDFAVAQTLRERKKIQ